MSVEYINYLNVIGDSVKIAPMTGSMTVSNGSGDITNFTIPIDITTGGVSNSWEWKQWVGLVIRFQ